MTVSYKLYASAAWHLREKNPDIFGFAGWLDPKAGLDAVEAKSLAVPGNRITVNRTFNPKPSYYTDSIRPASYDAHRRVNLNTLVVLSYTGDIEDRLQEIFLQFYFNFNFTSILILFQF